MTVARDAVELAAGAEHTCARAPNGEVSCWGANFVGELGDGTTAPRAGAVRVAGLADATGISTAAYTTCASRRSGGAVCWGSGGDGELGDGRRVFTQPMPVTVLGLGDTAQVAVGFEHACALSATGTVTCWGRNSEAQLGDGTTLQRERPVAVVAIGAAARIATGGSHSCALLASGSVMCWGDNSTGQLGTVASAPVSVPALVPGLTL